MNIVGSTCWKQIEIEAVNGSRLQPCLFFNVFIYRYARGIRARTEFHPRRIPREFRRSIDCKTSRSRCPCLSFYFLKRFPFGPLLSSRTGIYIYARGFCIRVTLRFCGHLGEHVSDEIPGSLANNKFPPTVLNPPCDTRLSFVFPR